MLEAKNRLAMQLAALGLVTIALTACVSNQDAPPPPPELAAPPPPPAEGGAKLDDNVTVAPPEEKVPKQYAAFSGTWSGIWDDGLDAKLVVRSVTANGRVTVTYAWGRAGGTTPGIVDGQGKISGSRLKLDRFASGVDTVFTLQPDGTLAGTYTVNEISHQGIFRLQ